MTRAPGKQRAGSAPTRNHPDSKTFGPNRTKSGATTIGFAAVNATARGAFRAVLTRILQCGNRARSAVTSGIVQAGLTDTKHR